jgi:hypothetical protein
MNTEGSGFLDLLFFLNDDGDGTAEASGTNPELEAPP